MATSPTIRSRFKTELEAFRSLDANGDLCLERGEIENNKEADISKNGVVTFLEWLEYKKLSEYMPAVSTVLSKHLISRKEKELARFGVTSTYDRLLVLSQMEYFEDPSTKSGFQNLEMLMGALTETGASQERALGIITDSGFLFGSDQTRENYAEFLNVISSLGIGEEQRAEMMETAVREFWNRLEHFCSFVNELRRIGTTNDEILSILSGIFQTKDFGVLRWSGETINNLKLIATDDEIRILLTDLAEFNPKGLGILAVYNLPDILKRLGTLMDKDEAKDLIFNFSTRLERPRDCDYFLSAIPHLMGLKFLAGTAKERLTEIASFADNNWSLMGSLKDSGWMNDLEISDELKRTLLILTVNSGIENPQLREILDKIRKIEPGATDAEICRKLLAIITSSQSDRTCLFIYNGLDLIEKTGPSGTWANELSNNMAMGLLVDGHDHEAFEKAFPDKAAWPDILLKFNNGEFSQFCRFLTNSSGCINGKKTSGEELITAFFEGKEKLGLKFMGRYSYKVIKALLNDTGEARPGQRTAVVVTPITDHNGAFYNVGKDIEALIDRGYRIVHVEADNESEIYDELSRMTDGSIDLLLIAGHGSTSSTRLSNGGDEASTVDTTDSEWKTFAPKMKKDSRVILLSCSTASGGIGGENMLTSFIDWFGAVEGIKVFAPPVDVSVQLIFSDDGQPVPSYNNGYVEPIMGEIRRSIIRSSSETA